MGAVSFLAPLSALPPDLPSKLRELAAQVEAGTVTQMVVALVDNGEYRFLWPSPKATSIVLTALAHDTALGRLRT